ncbi:MAG TPA: hypothetical protein VFQ89_12425, partial [Candidatus Binatia bacterium]|nr:hypothetical protein [Candidatus Binatia bacterium]
MSHDRVLCKQPVNSFVDRSKRGERVKSQMDSHSAEVIQAWLVAKLSERLGIESHEIDVREPF